MRHRKDLRVIEFPMNHYQVLRSEQTVDIIRDAIGRAKPGFLKKNFGSAVAKQLRLVAD
jgi:hypothetical protein